VDMFFIFMRVRADELIDFSIVGLDGGMIFGGNSVVVWMIINCRL